MSYNIFKYNEVDGAIITSYSEDSIELFNVHVLNKTDEELVNPVLPEGVPIKFLIKDGDMVTVNLDYKKSSSWDLVKSIRNNKYEEDITTIEGIWQVDQHSINSIISAIRTLDTDIDTISWRTTNNNMIELTKPQLNTILTSYDERRISIFNASINVKADIDACTTVEEVNALGVASLLSTYTI